MQKNEKEIKKEIINCVIASFEDNLKKLNNCLAFFKGYFDSKNEDLIKCLPENVLSVLGGIFND